MSTMIHARAIRAIDPLLSRGPWSEGPWDPRGRRASAAMLQGLREALTAHPPMTAVASARAAAKSELPLMSAAWHEVWARVTLVWAVREVTRAAHAEPDANLRDAMLRVSAELAAAGARLATVDAPAPVHFEELVERAREAFSLARDGIDPTSGHGAVVALMLQQLRHTASLLVVGGHSVDELLRGAIARADRAARRDDRVAWSLAPLAVRQSLAERGLVDAAWALAAHVPALAAQDASSRDTALWLARTAVQLAARVDRVGGWVPAVPEDAARQLPRGAAPLPRKTEAPTKTEAPQEDRKTERAMETNKLSPVLKTLENDAGEAAWRLAGSQFVKLAKEPLVALLCRQLSPGDDSFRARLASFLDTEVGSAILASLLSVGLSALPLPNPDVTQRLSRELRVRAMAGAGDVLADVLMGPLRQVAVMYLQGVPNAAPGAPADPAALPGAQVLDALRTAASVETHVPAA